MKGYNPEMLIMLCETSDENLQAKNIRAARDLAITCINPIRANAKGERLFKHLCEGRTADHVDYLSTMRLDGCPKKSA